MKSLFKSFAAFTQALLNIIANSIKLFGVEKWRQKCKKKLKIGIDVWNNEIIDYGPTITKYIVVRLKNDHDQKNG